jgi:hypothetical protein
MISGAGMLDFLACFSTEKLVVDAEAIAMAQRLLQGLRPRTATLATGSFAQAGPRGDFLRRARDPRDCRARGRLRGAGVPAWRQRLTSERRPARFGALQDKRQLEPQ